MTGRMSPFLGLILWIIIQGTTFGADEIHNKCLVKRDRNESTTIKCANFFPNYTSWTIIGAENMDTTGAISYLAANAQNDCHLKRSVEEIVTDCCDGWTGTDCETPICSGGCKNGGTCVSKDLCSCTDDFTGADCSGNTADATDTSRFCYESSRCVGAFKSDNSVVSLADCCGDGTGSWGVGEFSCMPCVSANLSNPGDSNVITQEHDLDFRSCMYYNGGLVRTFDGVMFLSNPGCVFILLIAPSHGYEVDVDTRGCTDRSAPCTPIVLVRDSTGKQVKIHQGKIYSNTDVLIPAGDEPVIDDATGMEVVKLGRDWVEVMLPVGIKVKQNIEGTITYITVQKDSQLYGDLQGICGNGNGNAEDDQKRRGGSTTNSVAVFMKSWVSTTESQCTGTLSTTSPCTNSSLQTVANTECQAVFDIFEKNCKISVSKIYESCRHDYCSATTGEKRTEAVCNHLSLAAQLSAQAGCIITWRSEKLCPRDDCPANQIFSDCASPFRRTCDKIGKEDYQVQHCVATCDCPAGQYIQNDTCVDASECRCRYKGHEYAKNEVIKVNCNNCTCNGGKWFCTTKTCDSGCLHYGHSHMVTFDDLSYSFEPGPCEYTFVTVPSESSAPQIIGQYAGDQRKFLDSIKVLYKDVTVEIIGRRVKINNKDITEAVAKSPHLFRSVLVTARTSIFFEIRVVDFRIFYDGYRSLTILLSPNYLGKPFGICGNFNHKTSDDLEGNVGGIITTTYKDFIDLFSSANCYSSDRYDNPPRSNDAVEMCKGLVDDNGIFKECLPDIPKHNLYDMHQACMDDYDFEGGKTNRSVCDVYMALTMTCSLKSINDLTWTQEVKTMCSEWTQCHGIGQVFKACASSCSGNCMDLQNSDTLCNDISVPGCVCSDGQYTDGYGDCVSKEDCTCSMSNEILQPGASFMMGCENCNCTDGKVVCAKCPDTILKCPKNQVKLVDASPCRKKCSDRKSQMTCDTSLKFNGCGCPDDQYMANDVRTYTCIVV